jgi:hypothetical protein
MNNDKKFDIEDLFYNITMENPSIYNPYADKHEKEDKCNKNNKQEKHEKEDKCDKYDKQDKCKKEDKCDKDKKECKTDYSKTKDICIEPCELCKTIKAEPVDIEKNGVRLLTVKIKVNNVCFGKKIAIACIIYDKCHRILALKGFTTILCKEYECGRDACGTVERKLVFVIPDHDICDPLELDVRILANYVYPCEPEC